MGPTRKNVIVRLCLGLVRACAVLVPARARREWRQEWEGELHYRQHALEASGQFDRRGQLDLLWRTLGALPDAAWLRRQFTADADLVHDVRHGARMLRKSPLFALSAVAILAVGIGSTVAVASLLDTLMLRPLPYEDATRVMTLWQRHAHTPGELDDVAPANFLDWRERARAFSGIAAAVPYSYDYTASPEPQVLFGAQVTEGFFEAIGARLALGRPFAAAEHVTGGPRVVIISHQLWQRLFAADPTVIGRTVPMDGLPFTVVGVLHADFQPQLLPRPGALEVWTPKAIADHERRTRGSAWWNVVARLRDDVTPAQAQQDMDRVSRELAAEHPSTNGSLTAVVVPLREHLMGAVRLPLMVSLAAVILVLAIGCANVASLLLARGLERDREFAVRTALGAGRGRLVRQLVTESMLLSAVAAAAGLALAHWSVSVIVALAPAGVMRLQEAAIDGRALALAAALALLTSVAFGLLPALQFSRPVAAALRDRGPANAGGRFRRGLVAAEVALALILLTGAGLLVRSFERLTAVDPGFDPHGVVSLQVFAYERNQGPDQMRTFFQATLDRLAQLPGVQAAGAVSAMPFASANIDIRSPLDIAGRPTVEQDRRSIYVTVATPGYFDALSVPLRAGRRMSAADHERAPRVALISEALQRRDWAGTDPIGDRIAVEWHGRRLEAEIVGVVGQIRHDGFDRAPRAEVFLPHAQVPFGSMTYVLKAQGSSAGLIARAQQEVWAIDPLQTFYESASLEERVHASVVRERFSMTLLSAFALIALVLCAIGIYGVISFTTAQRTREIGVRIALGADTWSIQRLVIGEGAIIMGMGGVAGIAGALAGARYLQALLFETDPGDPATLLAVTLLLTAVGLLAAYLPARRATRVDPVVALRDG